MSNEIETSKLRLYSLGIVVDDKPENTDIIFVSPVETLNVQPEGDIKNQTKEFKGQKTGVSVAEFKTQHESKNYLRASWIPFGHSNRITAPDVVRNETVVIFKYADIDRYFWTTIFREPSLRRLETVMYAWSNIKDGITQKSFDKSTSYWFEVSTRHKKVTLKTMNNDGEHTTYEFSVDTKAGIVKLVDGKSNILTLNSPTNTWFIENAAKKSVKIHPGGIDIVGNTRIEGTLTVSSNTYIGGHLRVAYTITAGGHISGSNIG